MSFFNIPLNCSPKCAAWEDILLHYSDWVNDDEVWEFARESKKLPVLGNFYQHLVLERIISHFCDETGLEIDDLNIFFWINSIDTHLVINDWDICTVDDYWNCVKQNRIH
ncbi:MULTISPECIES: hypothetical protein [Pasteurellaceae]|uniref:Uncharacterized protein n=3 Tax=Pasteurellaceae TaxID=712 RepID=A0A084EF41_GLAPU|nr:MULTISPECIES: hypothetical protein [Pasteurellaceae]EQA02258.1 hypothetical protein HPSMNH_0616 [Glaesserella parasuis MN-H]QOF66893.1 hypothetical protein IFE17_06840 [Actinobacillus sp. GY-402]QRX38405.1 hypothetical protein [Actinobacillus sp.]KEZ16583.1 hypothetical protein HS327_02172 [Glaesserella parasuis]MCT8559372.1 hypothetical protein [Glaesserella parasuis]